MKLRPTGLKLESHPHRGWILLEKVLAVDVFVTDMGKFADLNAIYAEYFSNHKPARAAIEVAGLPLGGLVEFKCIALAD